jgi:hypothetical protein
MPKKRSSQTAPGLAVYRLNFALRVPSSGRNAAGGSVNRAIWLPEGYEANENELAGLVVPALEGSGYLQKIKLPEIPCEACQAHGTATVKKERYNS